ncbi:Putative NADP-dependent oxidoreductase YfmJ [Paraconexibacter sp. AEG42_29]|uniref:NADP-dependent oxidoreductase YfmJ n=1 Tax=Paraconexibacter sp. AEG42_29 TaxID=2997339 RepID=A0AAU7AP55_9ACTN
MSVTSHQFRLAARPVGLPKPTDWDRTTEELGDPADGQFLVRVSHLSLDPAMRGWMNDARSYIPPVGLGEVMRAGAVGEVIASAHPKFGVGDHVSGAFGVQTHALSDGAGVVKVDPELAPLPVHLGMLGMSGMTAYFGLLDVGRPEAGQTVVVSGAAGSVGGAVGQIAKIKGCRVVGIAGGADKCRHVVEDLGFDACIDYKNESVRAGLRKHCPDRIDVYFDNVGGDILDDALAGLAMHARVVICGAISQYNATDKVVGPSNYLSLLVSRASMTGMVVFDYVARFEEAAKEMAGWMAEGRLHGPVDITEGLDNFPDALNGLFRGENTGKLVLAL